jgi:hypothetical protein
LRKRVDAQDTDKTSHHSGAGREHAKSVHPLPPLAIILMPK